MKRWLIRQLLIPWLRERALVLPEATRIKLAAKLGVPVSVLREVEREIREQLIKLLEE